MGDEPSDGLLACFEYVLLLPQLTAALVTAVLRLLDSSSSLLRPLGGERSVVGLEAVGDPFGCYYSTAVFTAGHFRCRDAAFRGSFIQKRQRYSCGSAASATQTLTAYLLTGSSMQASAKRVWTPSDVDDFLLYLEEPAAASVASRGRRHERRGARSCSLMF